MYKSKKRFSISLFFCVAVFCSAFATHNRAGEITYKWISGYTYQIKVTTYTNINGINLADRCEDSVYFGDGIKAVVLRSNGPISLCSGGAHDGVVLNSDIKLNEYITTHTYPGPGNYKISMEDPNRNAGVINIPNSVNQVFYLESYLVIPAFGGGSNDSPILTFPPIDDGCMGQCFYHNPGAYDTDGDSLSYELTYCRGNGGLMCPGYSDPTTGVGGVYSMNSISGTLTWCKPQMQGEYNLAMIIREWRKDDDGDYFLIGYVLRDMQVTVGTCNNNPPQITIPNIDTCFLAGTVFTNTVLANDMDGDLITLSANGGPFVATTNPANFSSAANTSATNGVFSWNTSYDHLRRLPYQITLKLEDSDPSINLVDYKAFFVKIIPHSPRNLTTTSSTNFIFLRWDKPINYVLTGNNSFLRYNVYRKTGLSSWNHSNNETAPPAYTGFTYIGFTNSISDTSFFDYNDWNPFPAGQDYTYLVLAEYTDGATSYVSNLASNQIYVGLKENILANTDITISPNPTNENLNVFFSQATDELFTIELFDITGRKIKTFFNKESLTKQNTFQLKLENLNQGIYFLRIMGDEKTNITKKIIKQ